MKRLLRIALVAWAPILALGCQNLNTAFDAPPVIPLTQQPIQYRNPDLIPWPKDQYRRLYEAALEVLFDYGFEIAEANLYSGDIEAVPRTSPGIGLLLKPGSPDMYDRLLSTLQSYRHRVTIKLQPADRAPADHGGYIVEFIVRKELEDVARPIRSSVGGAVFRSENTVERQTEVIDATFLEPSWIFRGRDCGLEQEMIRRFKHALARPVCN